MRERSSSKDRELPSSPKEIPRPWHPSVVTDSRHNPKTFDVLAKELGHTRTGTTPSRNRSSSRGRGGADGSVFDRLYSHATSRASRLPS